jgi:hypothetical protein
MNSGHKRVATGHLLDPKPQALTEQELQHMEALARVMYAVYVRQRPKPKTEGEAPRVTLDIPRVFTAASTTCN